MKDFKIYQVIPAEPEEVYAALTNDATLQLWTGEKAEMTAEPGTEFSLWDGSIAGRNLEFEPGKKIVQEWYFGDDQHDASIVTIKLHKDPKGTSMEVRHTNIPDEDYENITDGWKETYIGALLDFYS